MARLGRARSANQERRSSLSARKSLASSKEYDDSCTPPPQPAIPVRSPIAGEPASSQTPQQPVLPHPPPQTPDPSTSGAAAGAGIASELAQAGPGATWHWCPANGLLAVVDAKQLLRVMSRDGELKYRVQLPPEGSIVFLGWEKNGRVLAAVQKLGGAFLWFPSKPQTMQQWEGMQFSSKMIKSGVLKTSSHFDTSFACWSEKARARSRRDRAEKVGRPRA